jgi:hypothetical protein
MEQWQSELLAELYIELKVDNEKHAFPHMVQSTTMFNEHVCCGKFWSSSKTNIGRGRMTKEEKIWCDYFAQTPMYDDKLFKR